MKKLISLLAVIALIACFIPAAFAAEPALYATTDAAEYLEAGDTFTVTVGVSEVAYAALDLYGITYDEGLEFVKTEGASGRVAAGNPPHIACIAFADSKGDAVTLTFKVADNAADGKYTISFNGPNEYALADKTVFELGTTSVTVQVGEPHVCEFGEWVVTTPATCETAGVETRTCSCGATETREIPALGHDWDNGVIGNEGDYDCPDEFKLFTCKRDAAHTKTEKTGHDCEKAKFTLDSWYDAEKKANYTTYQEKCVHSDDHGCSTVYGEPWTEEVKDPITGDITPYIAMGVLTMVALVSAAAYMLLKRKAI